VAIQRDEKLWTDYAMLKLHSKLIMKIIFSDNGSKNQLLGMRVYIRIVMIMVLE
jgi:hypothetical protein